MLEGCNERAEWDSPVFEHGAHALGANIAHLCEVHYSIHARC